MLEKKDMNSCSERKRKMIREEGGNFNGKGGGIKLGGPLQLL